MKKSIFLLGLLTTAICLSACGSKDYISFEEALDILEHNNMKEILKQADEHIKQYVLRCGIQRGIANNA